MSSFQLERLDALLRDTRSASDPEVRTALERLHLELVERLSSTSPQSHEFFLRSFRLIKGLRGNGNSSLRIACLRQSILYFFHHAKFDLAFEAAEHQHSVANQVQAIEARQRSLNSMGTALAELGDVHQALIHYADALEIARYRESNEDQAIVLNNIGTALNYASLYRDAIPCFNTSLSLSRPVSESSIAKKSSTNLAQSLYYLERFDEALDAIRHALESKSPPSSTSEHFDRALREFTLVQIALELGRSSLASEHANKCQEHAVAAKSISRTLMARIASARCEVRTGNAARGLEQLDALVVECMKIDSMYKDALIAAVKANDEAGKFEQALSYMERLLSYASERRLKTIEALMSSPVGAFEVEVDGQSDLGALEHNHAQLRARVAERQVASSTWEMLERLAITADIKEEASGEHGYRVGRMSALLAARIGWSDSEADAVEVAGRLHDIGKIAIPERILGSSETLRGAERHFMSAHAEIGAELLARSGLSQLKIAHTVARHHHERWDGSGYPDNLNGTRIPIHARIVAIADVFDALTHGRPFSAPWTVDRALGELIAQRGSQFDPHLVDIFVALISDLRRDHESLDTFLSEAAPKSPFLQIRRKIRMLLEKGRAETRSTHFH